MKPKKQTVPKEKKSHLLSKAQCKRLLKAMGAVGEHPKKVSYLIPFHNELGCTATHRIIIEETSAVPRVPAPGSETIFVPLTVSERGLREKDKFVLKPGSDAAIAAGCKCPVLDNNHGAGFMNMKDVYCMAEDCPVHGVKSTRG